MEEEGREEDNAMDIDSIDGWYVSETQDEDVELLYSETDDKSLEKMATWLRLMDSQLALHGGPVVFHDDFTSTEHTQVAHLQGTWTVIAVYTDI